MCFVFHVKELGTVNSKIGPVFKINEILNEIFGELATSKQFGF